MFRGLRSPIDGAVPSSLAAEAAVDAVADAGSFTGRVGDLGLCFVNAETDGDVDPVFFTGGFAVEFEDAGAGFGADAESGFEAVAARGCETPDSLLIGFLISLAASFFGASLAGAALGEASFTADVFFGEGCLVGVVALVGVRGARGVAFLGSAVEMSVALDGADEVAGCVSIGAGAVALGSTSVADFAISASFGLPLTAPAARMDCGGALLACASFGFPLTGAAIGALASDLGACLVAVVAEDFGPCFVNLGALAFFASFASLSSKGEPFSIEPKPGVWSARAVPPDTALASFESDGSIPTVLSSVVQTGLSMYAFSASSFAPSMLLMAEDSAGALSSVTLTSRFAAGAGPSGVHRAPFVFGLSIASPSVATSPSPTPSPARASLLFSASFKPSSKPILQLGSTATKLVLTLERGLELSLVTLPARDRPREGGDVFSLFCSNLARREATPVLGDRPDMTIQRRSDVSKVPSLEGVSEHHWVNVRGQGVD